MTVIAKKPNIRPYFREYAAPAIDFVDGEGKDVCHRGSERAACPRFFSF